MKHLELYESFHQRTMVLKHKNHGEIKVDLEGSRINNVENTTQINFPFNIGSSWNMSIYTWACNNNFLVVDTLINGRAVKQEDPCPEQKIFGVRTKDVPQGHEWRTLFPNKFRR